MGALFDPLGCRCEGGVTLGCLSSYGELTEIARKKIERVTWEEEVTGLKNCESKYFSAVLFHVKSDDEAEDKSPSLGLFID